jgi:prepilin signal peptidase PulO-like enzyme (type II secretory pathway)
LGTSYALVAGFFGLLLGSAINAMVWRLYVGRSWVRGRSMCPDCGHELAARDLVPVMSWMLLRGKCRYCGKKIHWQYPVVEMVTAVAFGVSAYVIAASGDAGILAGFAGDADSAGGVRRALDDSAR